MVQLVQTVLVDLVFLDRLMVLLALVVLVDPEILVVLLIQMDPVVRDFLCSPECPMDQLILYPLVVLMDLEVLLVLVVLGNQDRQIDQQIQMLLVVP
jgi:hypothetical protein